MFSCFLNSLTPSLCPLRRVCTLLLCLPHCAVLPRCCLLWLALLWPASQAFSSSSSSSTHTLSPSPPSRPHHSIYLPSLDNDSQHGRHGRDCSKRKVRGSDRVEALLQPLSWCDCPWSSSCSSACLPPPLRRTEATCGSRALPCMMAAPAPAVLCPSSARRPLALAIIMTPPPTTSSIHALLHLPLASEARSGRLLVLSLPSGGLAPFGGQERV